MTHDTTANDALDLSGREPVLAFPVVGIGASAGGIDALRKFFEALPEKTGMAFVVVLHLHPEHESHLAELLGRVCKLPLQEVTEDTPLAPDHVFVIRPRFALTIEGGTLRLNPAGESPRHPVDTLFRSMADEQHEKAIAIVLSGSGSNGSAGALRIKEEGGAVFVQDPQTAQHDGMPLAAITNGVADLVLPPEDLPEKLLAFGRHPYVQAPAEVVRLREDDEPRLDTIRALLKAQTGSDFGGYKPRTLLRRIRRRMGLCHVEDLNEYAEVLRNNPQETTALTRDLMINVTAFFRDKAAWDALEEKVIEPLVRERDPETPIRAWVPACSTGEEAYSLAMLLIEHADAANKPLSLKVFATDAAPDVLSRARNGLFPASAAEEMPADRLERFFEPEGDFYRASKRLREAIVFAPQNVLSDPPFSRIDLVTCRNMLIYLHPKAQRQVVSLMHFALREGGYLFLGTAETLGDHDGLFATVSKKWRIYRRLGPTRHDIVDFPLSDQPSLRSLPDHAPRSARGAAERARTALLERFAPPAVLIDDRLRVHYFHAETDRYLRQPRGEPTQDLLQLARDEVAARLRAAVHRAMRENASVSIDARLSGGNDGMVRIHVEPLDHRDSEARRLLVTFHDLDGETVSPAIALQTESTPETETELEEALRASRAELSDTIEQLESSNEELKASNEEITSMNEELQSTNEELETSKEELQSLNEELNTVNVQLQGKLEELESQTNDIDNLLKSSAIATLFLDRNLTIRWFTPAVRDLMEAMSSDVGRPITHLARKFDDPDFVDDARAVLETLQPREREVTAEGSRWFVRRTLPYRTEDDRIEGVVITFTEITSRKHTELRLRRSKERFEALVQASAQIVWAADAEGNVAEDSPSWRAFTGQSREDWLASKWPDCVHPNDRERVQAVWRGAVARVGMTEVEFRLWHAPSQDWRITHVRAVQLKDEKNRIDGWVGMNIDITERRQAEQRQQLLLDDLQHRVKNLFANTRSLLTLSSRGNESVEAFVESFSARLGALERTQDVMNMQSDNGLDLRGLLAGELAAFGADASERVAVEGPDLPIKRSTAQALGMVLHELTTNAVKYGALSTDHGRIFISWTTVDGETPRMVFRWRETGVPMAQTEPEPGFGTQLIRDSVPYMLGGTAELSFLPDGVRCMLDIPLSETDR